MFTRFVFLARKKFSKNGSGHISVQNLNGSLRVVSGPPEFQSIDKQISLQ
jgi:hypothetical protein